MCVVNWYSRLKIARYLLILLCFSCHIGGAAEQPEGIVDNEGHLSAPLLSILKQQGIQHDGTLRGVVYETQRRWIRPPNDRQWFDGAQPVGDNADLYPLLQRIGVFREDPPSQTQYRYAVVLGSRLFEVHKRLTYLVELWKSGVRFERIVLLTGARPVDPVRENVAAFFGGKLNRCEGENCFEQPETEARLVLLVFGQLDVPAGMRKIPLTLIDAPMTVAGGERVEPNIADMLMEWVVRDPAPGRCLLVSSQPYVAYHDTLARSIMPREFEIETVGKGGGTQLPAELHLHYLARWLYAQNLLLPW